MLWVKIHSVTVVNVTIPYLISFIFTIVIVVLSKLKGQISIVSVMISIFLMHKNNTYSFVTPFGCRNVANQDALTIIVLFEHEIRYLYICQEIRPKRYSCG